MKTDWPTYFRTAHAIERVARTTGMPRAQARTLGEELACRPLAPDRARALMAQARGKSVRDESCRCERSAPCTCGAWMLRVGQAGSADPRVVAAHELLHRLEPGSCPPLDKIRVYARDGYEGVASNGYVLVNPEGALYRGSAIGLALLLHHENYHLVHPHATEQEARAASIRFAEQHGPELVASVREAPV